MPRRIETYQPLGADRLAQLQSKPLASFRARAFAFIIDGLAIFAIVAAIEVPLQVVRAHESKEIQVSFDFAGLLTFVVVVAYFSLTNCIWNGRTLGKRLLGIRVLSIRHGEMSLSRSIRRALAYSVSFVTFGLGFLEYFRHPNRQTVHDRIAETIVVKEALGRRA